MKCTPYINELYTVLCSQQVEYVGPGIGVEAGVPLFTIMPDGESVFPVSATLGSAVQRSCFPKVKHFHQQTQKECR